MSSEAERASRTGEPNAGNPNRPVRRMGAWPALLALALTLGGIGLGYALYVHEKVTVISTVADVFAVHAEVRVGDAEVRGERRISDGDRVTTGPAGRARLRLDDGTIVAVDGSTRLSLSGSRLLLESGRIFVQGGRAAVTTVSLENASTTVASSAVAFERKTGASKIYCANGELLLSAIGKQTRIASGETATVSADGVKVTPEKAFNDWTGGLAVPWANEFGGRSAIPEARALSGATETGTPLVIRAEDVSVEIEGELAITRAKTTYFNGSSSAARSDVRLVLPKDAILRRVARRFKGATEQEAVLAIAAGPSRPSGAAMPGLEWAGAGWLRGDFGHIPAGATLELTLEYVQWLPTQGDVATYRFPMTTSELSQKVGELRLALAREGAEPRVLSVSAGTSVEDDTLRYRRADVAPTSDWVVELESVAAEGTARAYVMNGPKGEDPYVLVRTEVPPTAAAGVALVLVVDASMSVGTGGLESERAVVDALLEGLGPKDSLLVLAADQTLRPLGPAKLSPVNAELRKKVRKALAQLRPGGGSNLGLALQRAADMLDSPSRGKRAGSGMVVYIGDGRPTLGEQRSEDIRRLISRRSGGMPRLSAIAVGPSADRWMLGRLVAEVGGSYEVADRSDAARAGAALLADALRPTLRDVKLDLGPSIDRIYPREARAALAGSTVSVIGRLRGQLPKTIGFRFRSGSSLVEQTRPLRRRALPMGADLPQRWALSRIEEMAAQADGIEPAIVLAASAKLLTPWTGWFFSPPVLATRPFWERVLELSPTYDTAFASWVTPVLEPGSSLLEPPRSFGGGVSLKEAAEAAIRRILEHAAKSMRACRDARASVRPDLGRSLTIDVSLDGGGQTTRVNVTLDELRGGDPVLERCIQGVVESLPYFAVGMPVSVRHTLRLPEVRSARRTQCSKASKVSLPIRKSLWRARQPSDAEAYLQAARSCELPDWNARRAFLLLMLDEIKAGEERLRLSAALEAEGETDAARFLRQETLRRVTDFRELEELSRLLQANEPKIDAEFEKAYAAAKTDQARLEVVRDFLRLAPHSGLVRRRLFALLEALGRSEALVGEIQRLRASPIVEAGLLAEGASALRRIGLEQEGQRAFGELIERAPRDPWTLAYVGDRLRAEGMFDEAVAAYDSLARLVPGDAGVLLRMAMAHAGAGRLDVATRLLDRVTQTGGRGDDGRLGELSSITQAYLLAKARGGKNAEVQAELERRLLQTPLPDVKSVVLIQTAPADDPIEVRVVRESGEGVEQGPDLDARVVGLAAIRVERGDGATRIHLRRPTDPGPSRPIRATVAALLLGDRERPALLSREVEIAADGKGVELRLDGEKLL